MSETDLGADWEYQAGTKTLSIPVPASSTPEQAMYSILEEIENFSIGKQDNPTIALAEQKSPPVYELIQREVGTEFVYHVAAPYIMNWYGVAPNIEKGTLITQGNGEQNA